MEGQLLRQRLKENSDQNKVPKGCFYAPLYALSKKENHGMGYHAHLLAFPKKGYIRAGYVITRNDSNLYIVEHGSQLFSLAGKLNGIAREISPYVGRIFGKVASKDMLRVPRGARILMPWPPNE